MEAKRKKYNILMLDQRREIIELFKSNKENNLHSNCKEIAKQFNVSDITIRRIRDSLPFWEEQIEKSKEMPSLRLKKKVRIPPKNVLLEKTLYEWFQEKRAAGQPVSGDILKEKALIINAKIKGDSGFKASNGWLTNFNKRYLLRSCSMQGKKQSADFEDSVEFVEELASIIRMRNFQLYQIYSADETGLLWRMLPSITFIAEYEKEASGFKFSNERVTVMVCANADGSHKIPLFVIGESKNPRCFKNVNQLPVTYEGQKNAWMTRELFEKWYINIFLPSVHQFQARRQQTHQVLLILDNAKCHLSKEELESIDEMCIVKFLPPNVTSLIQPMNQGVIEKMKKFYRKSFLRDMLVEENEESLLKFVKSRNMKTCCSQIARAWSQITELNICRSWRKLLPSWDLDMSTSVTDVTVDEFLDIFYRIPGFESITPTEVSTWLEIDANEPGWEPSSIEQILQRHGYEIEYGNLTEERQLEQHREEDEEDEEDEEYRGDEIGDDGPATPDSISIVDKAKEAYESFKKFRDFYEQRWQCDSEDMVTMQKLNENIADIVSQLNLLKTTK